MQRCGVMKFALLRTLCVLLLSLAFGSSASAQKLSSKIREQLEASTVYIKTKNDEDGGTGSGFVVKTIGNVAYIATNNHVIDPEHGGRAEVNEARTRLKVVFHGEDRDAEPVRADLVATDPAHDLAILRVLKKDPPPAFDLFSKQPLEETQDVTVFGFPLGDTEITINNGQVSGFRHNDLGAMVRIKFFAKVDPGNSGGPIVDSDGALVGVTVEKDRRSEEIGYAIPAFELHEIMRGRLGNFEVKQEGGPGTWDFKFSADRQDPLKKLKSATLHLGLEKDISKEAIKAAVKKDGQEWSLLSDKMKEIEIDLTEDEITKRFPVTGEPGSKCYLQLSYKRDGEPSGISEPIELILGDNNPLRKPKGGEEDEDPKEDEDDKDRGKYPLPRELAERIVGKRVPMSGFKANEWNLDAPDIIPNMMWDKDNIFIYVVDRNGTVRKVDVFRNQVDLQLDLKIDCVWSVLSGEGLVLLTKSGELWIVDERNLKVRNVIEKIPGISRVTTGRTSFYGFCVTDDRQAITVFDLIDGEKVQHYNAADFTLPDGSGDKAESVKEFNFLTMTSDGRYLLCESGGALHRFSVTDDELTYEQAGNPIANKAEGLFISVDDLYVSLTDLEGNRKQGSIPIKTAGIYVFNLEDLLIPEVAVDGGQPTPLVVREDNSKTIFGTVKNSPLVRFDLSGTKTREFPELEGEFAKQILVYPRRGGFTITLTDEKIYVIK